MITSTANPQIKNLIQLQKKNRLRQEQGIFIIEGIKMYREAPTDQVIKTYVSESFYKKHQKEDIWKGESLEIVTDRVFEAASDTKTPQGVLSLVKRFEYDLDDIIQGSTPLIMVLENIQDPGNLGTIIRTADAFGVLPPVSILTPEQTKYYFLSGFTAKLAGTERGITEPTPTFSACFGQAFLELHPTKYAEELVKKMQKSGAKAYLVNTGWNGTGKRISIKDTRGIIDAILSGAINEAPTKKIPHFDFEVPTSLPGVDPAILDPRDTYKDAAEWETKAVDLASRFIKNFAKYEGNEHGKALVAAGPKL